MAEKKHLDYQGLQTLVENLKEYISNSSDLTIQQFTSLYNFPNVGSEHTLYIDKTANKSYRWDDADLKYYVVGSDYNDIEIVNGGMSSEN